MGDVIITNSSNVHVGPVTNINGNIQIIHTLPSRSDSPKYKKTSFKYNAEDVPSGSKTKCSSNEKENSNNKGFLPPMRKLSFTKNLIHN